MGSPMESAETFGKARELESNLPGFFLVWLSLSIFGVVSLVVIRPNDLSEVMKRSLEFVSLAVPLTIALYRLGNFWDDYVFDAFFSPKTDEYWHWLGSGMRTARGQASAYLRTGSREAEPQAMKGIYRLAKELYEGSDQWNQRVKRPLELSKTIRSFIMPLSLIALYDLFHEQVIVVQAQNSLLNDYAFLAEPLTGKICAALAIAATFLYLWLRVKHMREMYDLVVSRETAVHFTRDPALRANYAETLVGSGCLVSIGCTEAHFFCRRNSPVAKSLLLLFSTQHAWSSEPDARARRD